MEEAAAHHTFRARESDSEARSRVRESVDTQFNIDKYLQLDGNQSSAARDPPCDQDSSDFTYDPTKLNLPKQPSS